MPDCPGLCDNTEPIIDDHDDATATDPIPMGEYSVDPDARQVIPFTVILEIGGAASREGPKDLRDTTCPFTRRPCQHGCFDRR